MMALIILSILVTWLFTASVCAGVGGLLTRGLRAAVGLSEVLWFGMALITGFLQLYHFFRPIDSIAVYLIMGLGLAGWISNRKLLLKGWGEEGKPGLAALLLLMTAAIIAFRCAAVGEHYDTGLYGAQAVRWFITYPLVPGLGNVIGQLGFNSSVFLWFAALDQGPWQGLSHHLFVGFVIVALFASILPSAVRLVRSESSAPIDWYFTLLFVPATIWGSTSKIVGMNTDLPTSVICLVAAGMLMRALDGSREGPGTGESESRPIYLVLAMALFSLAVTFKISSAVFASVGWSVAAVNLWSVSRKGKLGSKLWVLGLALSAVFVLAWVGRGLILTGYPFFPSTALGIPVDWKVAAFETQKQAEFARSFARVPEITFEYAYGWSWLKPWFRELVREREGFLIPLFLMLSGLAAIIRTVQKKGDGHPRWFWLLTPALGGLGFWFLEAPAMRFGEPAMWTAGATLGTIAAVRFLNERGKIRFAVGVLVVLTAWAAHPRLFWGSYFRPSVKVHTFLRLPEAKLRGHQTSSGLLVNIPVETNQCWDAPLPCSFYFYDTLHLRKAGEMKRGFSSEASGPTVKWR
jgi:hypothetical protein